VSVCTDSFCSASCRRARTQVFGDGTLCALCLPFFAFDRSNATNTFARLTWFEFGVICVFIALPSLNIAFDWFEHVSFKLHSYNNQHFEIYVPSRVGDALLAAGLLDMQDDVILAGNDMCQINMFDLWRKRCDMYPPWSKESMPIIAKSLKQIFQTRAHLGRFRMIIRNVPHEPVVFLRKKGQEYTIDV
jgi:hypothetical protein